MTVMAVVSLVAMGLFAAFLGRRSMHSELLRGEHRRGFALALFGVIFIPLLPLFWGLCQKRLIP